jgi:hypothetical protein
MITANLFLVVLGLVLLLLAAFNVTHPRVHFGWLGLFLWLLSTLLR